MVVKKRPLVEYPNRMPHLRRQIYQQPQKEFYRWSDLCMLGDWIVMYRELELQSRMAVGYRSSRLFRAYNRVASATAHGMSYYPTKNE